MASEELVTEHFLMLGVEIEGVVLQKCVDLCNSNDLDPEAFAEQWMAFSLSHHNGAAPTLQLLELMERKEFSKRDVEKTFKGVKDHAFAVDTVYQHANTEYPFLKQIISHRGGECLNPNHVIVDCIPIECRKKSSKGSRENVSPKSNKIPKAEGTPASSICPVTYSPSLSQSVKYSSRSNSGDVLCSYGIEKSLESCVWLNTSGDSCKITQLPNHAGAIFSTKAMYGFELLQEKASIMDSNIKYLSQYILHKAGIKESVSVKCKSQVPVTAVGRIDCDANGRLNPKSVLLQGTWEESLGQSVSIDLDQLKQYSLFPGQVVAVKGLNVRGDTFLAQEIYCDASYEKLPKINPDESISGPLHIVVACGPYTTSDSLTYDPLTDIIAYVTKNKPHVLILIGPFVDANHQLVKDDTIAETYKSFFEKLVEKVMTAVDYSSPHTQVVFASSSKDVFHANIYPTPAFSVRKTYTNLTLVPDPCTLNIGGVLFGVTSTDILMHLSKEEISLPAQGPDKLGRLAGHLLHQQSFYPLWPPSSSLPVDTALWNEHAHMPAAPHVLLLPSDFRYFAKEINGCLVVNPERLTKGAGGGTFARLQVHAHSNQEMLCQILRI